MENLQATTLSLPQPVNTAAAPADPAATDPATGEALTGFQTLLARQLKDLLAVPGDAGTLASDAAATDEKTGDAGEDAAGAAATAAAMPWLALLQLVPAAPPAAAAGGQASISAAGVASDAAINGFNPAPSGGRGAGADAAAARDSAPEMTGAAPDFAARDQALPFGADRMPGRDFGGDSRDGGTAGAPQQGVLHNLPAAAPAAAAAQTPAQTQLATPLTHPAWGNELGQKLVWMVGDKQHVAEIHINPPQLGPIDIKLTVDGSETTAIFTSPHSEVRQVIESSLPKLREVLAESGIMLGNASVTADSPRDGSAFAQPQQRAARLAGSADGGAERELMPSAAAPVRARGMVDTFA